MERTMKQFLKKVLGSFSFKVFLSLTFLTLTLSGYAKACAVTANVMNYRGYTGDSFLHHGDEGYGIVSDVEFNDLNYSRDFTIETLYYTPKFAIHGSWAGVVSKGHSSMGYGNAMSDEGGFYIGFSGCGGGDISYEKGVSTKVALSDGDRYIDVGGPNLRGNIYAVMRWDADEKNLSFFVNGEYTGYENDSSFNLSGIDNSFPFSLGYRSTSTLFKGETLMVRIWNRELTEEEVIDLWQNVSLSGNDEIPDIFNMSGLHSQWLMNESYHNESENCTFVRDTQGNNDIRLMGTAITVHANGSLRAAYPADGQEGIDKGVFLRAVGGRADLISPEGPLSYYFQVDESSGFDSSKLKESGWIPHFGEWRPVLEPNKTYHWRVKGRDGAGKETGYTAHNTFKTEQVEEWYVRPQNGEYGNESGVDYENAFDGLRDLIWGNGGIEPGDTLYICGRHILNRSMQHPHHINQIYIAQSGISDEYPLTVRMDCPGDKGYVFGFYKDMYDNGNEWTQIRDNVYRSTDVSSKLLQDIDRHVEHERIFLDNIRHCSQLYGLDWGSTPCCDDMPRCDRMIHNASLICHTEDECIDMVDDIEGTIYYNGSYVYIHPIGDIHPKERIFEAGGYAINIADNDFLRFFRCNFYGPSQSLWSRQRDDTMPVSNNVTWERCVFKYILSHSARTVHEGNNHFRFINNRVEYCSNGVYSFRKMDIVDGKKFPLGDNLVVRNCTFKDIGIYPYFHQDAHAVGWQNGGNNFIIENNYIENTGSAIVYHTYIGRLMQNDTVRNNFIKEPRGGAISISGHHTANVGERSGNAVYNNIILRAGSNGLSGSPRDYVTMSNNDVYYSGERSFSTYVRDNGPKRRVYNNIFMYPNDNISGTREGFVLYATGNASSEPQIHQDHNVFYPENVTDATGSHDLYAYVHGYMSFHEWEDNTPFDNHSIIAGPQETFINPEPDEPGDFYPRWDSPTIDAGNDSILRRLDYFKDFNGNPIYGTRDIGALEYQPPYTMGFDKIEAPSSIRVYHDGGFRYLERSQTSQTISFSAMPSVGFESYDDDEIRPTLMDIEIMNHSQLYVRWSEKMVNASMKNRTYVVCDLEKEKNYSVSSENIDTLIKAANKSGCLHFNMSHEKKWINVSIALSDSTFACAHESDTPPCDGSINFTEIHDYLGLWIEGHIGINNLLEGVNRWR